MTGAIRLRVETGSHTCGSTAKTVQATLEGAIYDAAPDMSSLIIEGFEEKPSSGFVALTQLSGAGPSRPALNHSPNVEAPVTLETQGAD